MKLGYIWNAREAFGRLAQLRKPPKLAYRLLKYLRKINVELDLCETQRQKCVYEAAGENLGATDINLSPGTPEFDAFIAKFNEFLATDSDLEPLDLGMDALIDGLDSEPGNAMSENDLALLEPFFVVKQAE